MGQRLRFFLAQGFWVATAFGLALWVDQFSTPGAVLFPILSAFLITGFLVRWGSNPEQGMRSVEQNDNVVIRALVSGFMWLVFVGAVMAGVLEVGAVIIPLAVIMMIPLLALSSFMWKTDKSSAIKAAFVKDTTGTEKRKRDRVDAMIHDLSDEELISLKHRLAFGDIEEDDLKYMLEEDGEIVMLDERKRRS